MGIFHFNADCMKLMQVDQIYDFRRLVICHQKIGLASSQDVKQFSVVDGAMCIQSGASFFPPGCRVRRINKGRNLLSPSSQEWFQKSHTIPFNECNSFCVFCDSAQTFS